MARQLPDLSLRPSGIHRHENPAAAALERKMENMDDTKITTIQFPQDLLDEIRLHAVKTDTSVRDLFRTVLGGWIKMHLKTLDTVEDGTLDVPALEDRRKGHVEQGGEQEVVTIYIARDDHRKLRQVATIRRLTLRGVVVGIMREWAEKKDR